MSDQLTLSAETRERVGKGASRALRREGRIPAVIYGGNQEPVSIHVGERELTKLLMTGHFMNSVIMIDGTGDSVRTLPKDVAFDPVNDRPIHVDFFRISEHAKVHVNVPVVFTDEDDSVGIRKGGVLNVVRHELELVCDAASIPNEISVSVAGMDVGDSIHISNVDLPEGSASAIDDRDFTIATLVAPSALKSQEGDAEDEVPADEVEATAQTGDGETDAEGGDEA